VPLTEVQQKGGNNTSGTTLTVTYDTPPTQGNLLIATASGDTFLTMGSAGWTLATSIESFEGTYEWWKIAGAGESSSVLINGAVADSIEAILFEYSGNVAASPVDKTATNTPSSTTTPTTGTTAATTQADELALACFGRQGSNLTATYTNAFVSEGTASSPFSVPGTLLVASKALSATGTQTTTATLSGGTGNANGIIATYKAFVIPPTIPFIPHRMPLGV
jgi:hypothetical protein